MPTFEQARQGGRVYVAGCDTGPSDTALVLVRLGPEPKLLRAVYIGNGAFATTGRALPEQWRLAAGADMETGLEPVFLAYEHCGCQGQVVGNDVLETAMMCGEVRRAFRGHVHGTYALRPSDWRYALCGAGNARTPQIYAEFGNWFKSDVAAADPLKGKKGAPGPLALLHEAGRGGKMEHMKDALGVALALDRVRYRSGRDPEDFRRPW